MQGISIQGCGGTIHQLLVGFGPWLQLVHCIKPLLSCLSISNEVQGPGTWGAQVSRTQAHRVSAWLGVQVLVLGFAEFQGTDLGFGLSRVTGSLPNRT